MVRALAILALVSFATPAWAGNTSWHAIGEGSRIRLVTADTSDGNGLFWAALEIELAPETNTYWRLPGESGIPIVLTPRRNGSALPVAAMEWPLPERETVGSVMDYVYRERLVLPFALGGIADGDEIELDVRLGLCAQVCIPVSVALGLIVSLAAPDIPQGLRIEQARALAPIAYPGSAASGARIEQPGDVLVVEELASGIDAGEVIAEIVESPVLYGAPQATGASALAFAPLARIGASSAPGPGAGPSTVRLTFSTPDGAFEAELPLSP